METKSVSFTIIGQAHYTTLPISIEILNQTFSTKLFFLLSVSSVFL